MTAFYIFLFACSRVLNILNHCDILNME